MYITKKGWTGMISKSLIAASTKPMLLSILLNGESYGYQIIQRVRSLSGGQSGGTAAASAIHNGMVGIDNKNSMRR